MASRRETLVFALAAVILLVGIYLATLGRRSAPPPPPPAPTAKARTEQPTPLAARPAAEQAPPPGAPPAAGPRQGRNPFASPVAVPGLPSVSPQPGPPPETPAGQVPAAPPAVGPAPLGPSQLKPMVSGTPQAASPVVKLTLIGTVSGPTPMAVIRYGEQRFFVKEGEAIAQPSRYVVKSIRPGQVVLAGKQDRLVLNMRGGR